MVLREYNPLQAYDAFVSSVQVPFLPADLTQSFNKSAAASPMVKNVIQNCIVSLLRKYATMKHLSFEVSFQLCYSFL